MNNRLQQTVAQIKTVGFSISLYPATQRVSTSLQIADHIAP